MTPYCLTKVVKEALISYGFEIYYAMWASAKWEVEFFNLTSISFYLIIPHVLIQYIYIYIYHVIAYCVLAIYTSYSMQHHRIQDCMHM